MGQLNTMLQNRFLDAVTKGQDPVTIYLVNGSRLQGQVKTFDQYGLLLSGNGELFVFKNAIATLVPFRNVIPTPRAEISRRSCNSSVAESPNSCL